MKKILPVLVVSSMCALALALSACGGGASTAATSSADTEAAVSSAAAETSTSAAETQTAEASASAADAQATETSTSETAKASEAPEAAHASNQFTGEWKLAAFEYSGISVTGNLEGIIGWSKGTLTIAEDGTGSIALGENSSDFTWTQTNDTTISLGMADSAESVNLSSAVDLVANDGALELAMEDDGVSGKLIFTRDGSYAGARTVSWDEAKDITSEDALVGTWVLSGMTQDGAVMTGNPETLSAASGMEDTTLTFNAGGTGVFFGDESTYTVSESGTTLADDTSGVSITARSLDDDIIINIGEAFGLDMYMVFTKQA